jgi:hypothetical protein
MEGKDWLVAPAQMITEGVHNGSDGPIFYPASELAKLPSAWNHMPVVVYHPVENGQSVSARTPEQLTTRKIGVLMNTKWDGKTKKLGTETWLDPMRVAVVDNRVEKAIQENTMMEVSTGLYMTLEKKKGVWNGEEYESIAHELQPDHLALLPDQLGACSIADGAGFLRVNQEGDNFIDNHMSEAEGDIYFWVREPEEFQEDLHMVSVSNSGGIRARLGKLKSSEGGDAAVVVQSYVFNAKCWTKDKVKTWAKKHKGTTNLSTIIFNEMSHEETRRLLQSAIRNTDDDAWVEEVHDKYFIYESDGKLYKQEYTVADGIVSFVGLHKLVERQVTYVEVTALAANRSKTEKGRDMDKQEIVDGLIKNEHTSWSEEHRDSLTALDDALLANMSEDAKSLSELTTASEQGAKDDPPKEEDPKPAAEVEPKANAAEKQVTVEEYVAAAPVEIRESLQLGVNTVNTEKARLIEVIKANKANVFTEQDLKMMGLQMLQALARLATPETTERGDRSNTIPLYIGQGQPLTNNDVPEALPLPQMDFGGGQKAG